MPVIDLESFGTVVQAVEDVFKEHDCNIAEKQYILQQMQARYNAQVQQQRTQDLMSKIDPKSMIDKIMGKKE